MPDTIPDNMRAFDDAPKARQLIYGDTLAALQKRFPIEDDDYRLELHNPRYTGPQEFTLQQQKDALLKDRPLHTPITGTWRLTHKPTNKVVEEREDVVMHVPYYTDRGTFINNGSEYSVVNQARLRPGVYVRKQRTGNVEAHFNVKSGSGRPFRLHLEPETGIFKINVGQANIPVYPLLKAIGVTDKQLNTTWGPELVSRNAEANSTGALDKLYGRLAGYKADPAFTEVQKTRYLQEELPKFELDEAVTGRTLGMPSKGVTPELLLRATQKMLHVSRGEEQPDDRDSPMYSHILGVEDLMSERVEKDSGQLAKNLLRKAKRAHGLKPIQRGALSGYVQHLLLGSGLAQPLEETNTLHTLEQMNRITKLGEGGIGSAESITDEAREVNPGQVGFIDLISGPEGCLRGDSEVMTRQGWVRWDAVDSTTLFACMVNGRLEYNRAEVLHQYDFDGLLYGAKTKHVSYLVTPNHRMWIKKTGVNAEFQFESAEDMHGARRRLMTGGHLAYVGTGPMTFTLPPVVGGNAMKSYTEPIDGTLWGAFMGWYISEGCVNRNKNTVCAVNIAQHAGETTDELEALLDRLPFNWCKIISKSVLHGYRATSKQLYTHLHPLGGSHDKYIPEYLFSADLNTREALLRALCLGDGRKKRDTYTYCTTSLRLAKDVERLAFSLGHPTTLRRELDLRPQSLTGGTWCVHLHKTKERELTGGHNSWTRNHYFTEHHKGKVYCATVPGGLLYVKHGPNGGHWSGNSQIGVDVRVAHRTFKGKDRQLYGEFRNSSTGKMEYLSPVDTFDRTVAFPGEMAKDKDTVAAMRSGKVMMVPKKEVDFEIPGLGHMYSSHINLNPMPTGTQGGRQFYGSKFWSQYMPLKEGEVPLVDSLMDDGKTTFSEHYGRKVGTLKAGVDGTVVEVTPEKVVIEDKDGEQHTVDAIKNFSFNRLTGISYFPNVEVGQAVKADDMVAHSNFTDKKTGAIAMGRNLKCAIIPYRGTSFEDAYCISETAAQKLSTERLMGVDLEARNGIELGRNQFISSFPKKYTKTQIDTLDDDGIVRPGTVLQKGDPIVLAIGPKLLTAEDAQLGRLHKVLRNARTDKSEVWEYEWPGTVTDATRTRAGAKVNVKSTPPVARGDKLTSSYGIKGVVGTVIPDDQMPRDPGTNEPYEVLFNPMTIPSRIAPNQIVDIALGKLAKRTGQQVRIPQLPPEEGWAKWAKARMDEAKISDSADIFDPESGKTINNIGDGYVHLHAFHHLAEKKLSQRGDVGAYSADQQPARGGTSGSKRFSSLDVGAALAHGATEVIKDVQTIRGTKNEEYWKALRSGRPLPEPGVPFIYQKFLNTLRAGGINVSEKGDITKILPMTDDDVTTMSKGRIERSESVDSDFAPVPGGLFDLGKTGGASGSKWSHIELPEPIPNPVMEEPVRRLLGLKIKQLEGIVSGTEKLDGKTGGQAIMDALKKIDIDDMIADNRNKVRTLRGSNRDNAVKVLGYLSSAKAQGVHPSKWMITKVPVLPPMFRPVSRMGDVALSADLNELYRDVIESADAFKELKKDLPDESLADERMNIYGAVKAAYGLGEAITPEGQSKRLKGAIHQVIGDSPKFGMFQSKVISKPVDVIGRGVVTPDPNLDMDQIGIPADSAWTIYKDFVMRRLVRRGYPAIRAAEMIEQRDPHALEELENEMGERPVIVDRAPTWHKFNLLAFTPHIVEGHTVRVSPLITKGFTMDFDGDCQANSVFLALDRTRNKTFCENNMLLNRLPSGIMDSMNTKQQIPILDENYRVYLVDLADFPHGEFTNNVAGVNGPIDFFSALAGTKVLAFDERTHRPIWADVSHYSRHYQRAIEVVTLDTKQQVFTDDDPRAIYGIDPQLGLEFVRRTPTDAQQCQLAIPYLRDGTSAFGTDCPNASVSMTTDVSSKLHSIPLSFDFGFLLGALCGDGWWDKEDSRQGQQGYYRLYLADLQGEVAARTAAILRMLTGADVRHSMFKFLKADNPSRYGDTIRHTFSVEEAKTWALFLSSVLGGDSDDTTAGSGNKHLPPWIFTAPEACRRGMLTGLIDTDGTCCVTHGKERPQLTIAFSSTSLRLCREVSLLARTLGVDTSICFSKTTTRGNSAWIVTFSSVDCRRTQLFANLASTCKRSNFLETEVDMTTTKGNRNRVVLPDCIADLLQRWLPATRVERKNETEVAPEIKAERQRQWNLFQLVYKAREAKMITRTGARAALAELERMESMYAADRQAAIDWLKQAQGTVTPLQVERLRQGIYAVAPAAGERALYLEAKKMLAVLNAPLRTGKLPAATAVRILGFLQAHPAAMQVTLNPLLSTWRKDIVNNETISWAQIVTVEKTGQREDGYDLTVPGYETFMSVDGVILSNTVNFHVPASEKARDQALDKMMPSKNLFSLTDLKTVRHAPTMEMTLGMYWLTRAANAKKGIQTFRTKKEAEAAYRRGDLKANDPIDVLELK